MNLTLLRAAVRAFPRSELVPLAITRANRRNYIQARQRLGDRWLLAKPVQRRPQ